MIRVHVTDLSLDHLIAGPRTRITTVLKLLLLLLLLRRNGLRISLSIRNLLRGRLLISLLLISLLLIRLLLIRLLLIGLLLLLLRIDVGTSATVSII